MPRAKRHLLPPAKGAAGDRAACGLANPRFWSHDPAEVTCAGCARTVLMADAEFLKQQQASKPSIHSVKKGRAT